MAIGPPVENGFYYDFEFPEPIREEDLEAIETEVARELSEGSSWERSRPVDEARTRFDGGRAVQGRARRHRRRRHLPLHAGRLHRPLPRPAPAGLRPIKAFKLDGLAGAYWRGDEKNSQLTRIYGTAFFTQADLDAYLERLEQARANDHRRLGTQLDLFHFDEHSPGSPFWHPKGMALFNVLEDLRRSENTRRGYDEVRTPIIYDKSLWETSGHWEKFRENMFQIPVDEQQLYALGPMNCPGYMLLFRSRLPAIAICPSGTPRRGPPPQRARRRPARLTRVRYVTQDDAHIFCAEGQIDAELDGSMGYLRYLYGLFGIEPRAELSTRRTTSSARARSGTSPSAS